MTSRTWINDSGLTLSAANLNSLEADVQKGLDAKSAVDLITTNTWQPNTAYTVGRFLLDPNGITVKVTTAHTSGSSYDASKFTSTVVQQTGGGTTTTVDDGTIAGFLNTPGSASANAVSTAVQGVTRTNLIANPSFELGTSGVTDGTNTTFAISTSQKYRGTQSLAVTRSNANTGNGYARISFDVTAGQTYTLSAYVYGGAGGTNSYTFRAGGSAGSATVNFTPSNSWKRYSVTTVASSTGTGYIYITDDPNTAPVSGTVFYVDAVMAEQSSTLGTYFDGSTPGDSTTSNWWNGYPGYSTSTQRVGVKPVLSRTGAPPVGQGDFWVSVADFLDPNRVEGTTDDLPAFTAALAASPAYTNGKNVVRVYVPAGEYWISSAILMPSYSELAGAGIDMTKILLLPTASNDTWVVTNANPTSGGNTNISVHDMTLDWRWSASRPGGGGGTRSSCLTLRAVQYAWIDRVKAINSGLHCFDVAQGAIDYPYDGDGSAEPSDPSRYVWIRNCVGAGWGDDGITTHHSEYIWIENNYMYDPRERTNCNGIEIDDGSRHVFLANNMSRGCYGGIEIKAHEDANAAKNVIVNGHYDEGSVRSYNFRHIGHHTGTDPVSKSAYDIICTNLVSVNANSDKGFQDDTSPRALCISAYRRVSINGFTAIGKSGNYAAGDVAIAIQYWSSNISLSGINISGWTGADQDISVTSGDNISISGVNIQASAKKAMYIGATVSGAQIWGVNATAPSSGSINGIDIYTSAGVEATGISCTGYPYPVRSDGINYSTVAKFYSRVAVQPANTSSMKNLDPGRDYYFNTSEFAALGGDRPGPAAAAGGAYFVTHSTLSTDSVIQTVTRNTSGSSQAQYWRILNWVDKTAGPWNQVSSTQV